MWRREKGGVEDEKGVNGKCVEEDYEEGRVEEEGEKFEMRKKCERRLVC